MAGLMKHQWRPIVDKPLQSCINLLADPAACATVVWSDYSGSPAVGRLRTINSPRTGFIIVRSEVWPARYPWSMVCRVHITPSQIHVCPRHYLEICREQTLEVWRRRQVRSKTDLGLGTCCDEGDLVNRGSTQSDNVRRDLAGQE
jgi:hypothetical protein